MASRENEIKWANKLQQILGNGYEIRYDACDSGMTYCYYNGEIYKRVQNSEMCGNVNACEYRYAFQIA